MSWVEHLWSFGNSTQPLRENNDCLCQSGAVLGSSIITVWSSAWVRCFFGARAVISV
jgi:hypothetical protein